MTADRFAPCAGPQQTLEALAQRLFCIGGALAKFRGTGGHLSRDEVRLLVDQIDQGAADAERAAREIGEITDLIYDLGDAAADAEAPAAPWARVARLRPALTVIDGGRAR